MVITRRLTRSLALFALLLAGTAGIARAAQVEVSVDPPILSLGESVTVSFSIDDRSADPDFSPVTEDFDVLRSGSRELLQLVNGRAQQLKVYTLMLVPREAGTLEIPPIDFGNGVVSEAKAITVVPAREERPGESDVFIEVSLQPEGEVYVQSQVSMTVRLYYDSSVRMSNATLSDPQASAGDLVVEKIAEERSQEQIGERVYKVFEQRYALFPQRSGRLELDPIVFSADMRSYFERPAFRRVQSEPLALEVLPADPGGGRPWLPALAVTLEQAFPDADGSSVFEARVGEPITRSITLSALGLTAAQLPPVEMSAPEGFKVYPDKPTLDQQVTPEGILGERVERVGIQPREPGTYTLPAVEVEWWDTQADVPRTARLEPVTLRVLPATASGEAPAASAGLPAAAGSGAAGAAGAPGGAGGTGPGVVRYDPGLWPWAALFLAAGWALTGGWWWRSRVAGDSAPGTTATRRNEALAERLGAALRRLRAACATGDAPAIRSAVLAWARARWPDASIPDLIAVRQLAGSAMTRELDHLDASRYAPVPGEEGAAWQPSALVAAAEQLSEGVAPARSGSATAGLEPLYR